jgi:hypothetical protein
MGALFFPIAVYHDGTNKFNVQLRGLELSRNVHRMNNYRGDSLEIPTGII